MPCFHPLPGWYAKKLNPETQKRSIVFKGGEGSKFLPATVPCGTCIGCKLERSRQWALRCMHETKLHEDSCFVTLTYEDSPGTLVPSHYPEFMKRLRWHYGNGIRFFQCGEYGESFERPHHHALLWGVRFEDEARYVGLDESSGRVSKRLEEIWGHGRCFIGDVTFESAAYIARYTLKKVVGPGAPAWYQGRHPEFLTMSRRPGIGAAFLDKYGAEIYKDDSCIVRGAECKPPRYYDDRKAKLHPSVIERVKGRRRAAGRAFVDNSGSRLVVREKVKLGAVNLLRREFEHG